MSKLTCVVLETVWSTIGKHYRVAALADPDVLYTHYHNCNNGEDGKWLNLVEVYRWFHDSKIFPSYEAATVAAFEGTEGVSGSEPVLIFLPNFPSRAEVQNQALNDFDARIDRLGGEHTPVTHDELKAYLYRLVNLLELFREPKL